MNVVTVLLYRGGGEGRHLSETIFRGLYGHTVIENEEPRNVLVQVNEF